MAAEPVLQDEQRPRLISTEFPLQVFEESDKALAIKQAAEVAVAG